MINFSLVFASTFSFSCLFKIRWILLYFFVWKKFIWNSIVVIRYDEIFVSIFTIFFSTFTWSIMMRRNCSKRKMNNIIIDAVCAFICRSFSKFAHRRNYAELRKYRNFFDSTSIVSKISTVYIFNFESEFKFHESFHNIDKISSKSVDRFIIDVAVKKIKWKASKSAMIWTVLIRINLILWASFKTTRLKKSMILKRRNLKIFSNSFCFSSFKSSFSLIFNSEIVFFFLSLRDFDSTKKSMIRFLQIEYENNIMTLIVFEFKLFKFVK